MSALERILKQSLAREKAVSQLSDEALQGQWCQWSFDLLRQLTTLERILPEALAVVKEAAFRAGGLRAYPCQTRAIIALLEPAITEVATGEGKTLITALAACLRALPKRGVHVATVNAYLSERDFEFATPIAARLGLTVGYLKQEQSHAEKRAAYQCDITYGTGYDFGFDYLRDQLALLKHAQHGPSFRLRNLLTGREHPEAEVVQRSLASAIVDEIDSVLIDEAASPLVIAQPSTERTVPEAYLTAHEAAQSLQEGHDFILDARGRNARLTEEGRAAANQRPGIPWDALVRPWHQYLTNALNAHHAFHHGEHYILQEARW
nr:hypothetical protein [Verrucomicrobium spinosum]